MECALAPRCNMGFESESRVGHTKVSWTDQEAFVQATALARFPGSNRARHRSLAQEKTRATDPLCWLGKEVNNFFFPGPKLTPVLAVSSIVGDGLPNTPVFCPAVACPIFLPFTGGKPCRAPDLPWCDSFVKNSVQRGVASLRNGPRTLLVVSRRTAPRTAPQS
jgi:hypothetical protein